MVRESHTAGVDNVTKMNLMGMDTPPFTPRSSGIDSSSLPFVFSDGVLSFYSPSTDSTSSHSASSASPSASPVSNASFLGVLPDSPRFGKSSAHPVLQKLVIWRHNDEEKDHVYAETGCTLSPSIRDNMPLEDLDPSLVRYGAVHASLTQIAMPCPVMHVTVTLTPCSPAIAEGPHPINSVITISTPSRSPVRLMCAIYKRGTLAYSSETDMTEAAPSHFGDARYSTAMPQPLVDDLCRDVDGLFSREERMLDSIAVLQFMQLGESHDENVILVLVCEFEASQGPRPSQMKFSRLSLGTILSHDLTMVDLESLPTPTPSHENLSDVKHFALESIQHSKERNSSRAFPKLSVAIPPPYRAKGCIQLYMDSPGPSLTPDLPLLSTPQNGVPQNVFPVTPYDQLIATPFRPPEMHQSGICSRASHGLKPTESVYPFTLTAASPRTAQSPAFDRLDSSHPEESERPWPHPSRSCTPSTSSPLPRLPRSPYATSASNVMSSP